MEIIRFTNRQRIVKGCVVGILGLAVLLGSSVVTLAAAIRKANTEYCACSCSTKTGSHQTSLYWVKHPSIACARAEGSTCWIGEKGAPGSVKGEVKYCGTCTTDSTGEFATCRDGFPKPPSGPGSEKNPYLPDQNAQPEPKPLLPYQQHMPRAPGLPGQNAPVAPTPPSPQQRVQQPPMVIFQQAAPTVRGVEGAPASPAPTEEKATTPAPK